MPNDDDYSLVSVPQSERRNSVWVSSTAAAWVIALTTLYTGGSIASSMSIEHVIISLLVGMSLVTLIAVLMGKIGAECGVSTTILAHHTFGRYGAALLGAIIALTLGIGWFAWQLSFFATTFKELFPNEIWSAHEYTVIWGGFLMILSAFGGFKWLARLSIISIPIIFGIAAYGMITAISIWPQANQTNTSQHEPMSYFTAITAVVGSIIFGAIVLPDITRYSKSSSSGAVSAMVGYCLTGVVVIFSGAIMVAAVDVPTLGRTANIPAVMTALGMGWFALICLLLAQWTTNDSNLYSGSLGLSAVTKINKGFLVITMGIIGVIIAFFNIQEMFVPFLIILGTFMPPVGAVMIVDYYVFYRRSEENFRKGTKICKINLLATATVCLSGTVAYSTMSVGGLFESSALSGFIISFIIYFALHKIMDGAKLQFRFGQDQF